ncbi:MAG: sigma-70 family RNA polymerase sigma factor [Planctomycetes bacterium]|nr:sigma-70 family RNA polymerase sigma factor [Planctomycetota bacterium]
MTTHGEWPLPLGELERAVARYLPALRAFVRLRAGPVVRAKESCSDIVQSVCRELCEQASRLEFPAEAAFREWLFTTALHKVLAKHRYYTRDKRDQRREQPVGEFAGDDPEALVGAYRTMYTPSHDAVLREELDRVELVFDELPEDYKDVITYARLLGLPHREIAARMNRTEVATRHLLARALARLASALG